MLYTYAKRIESGKQASMVILLFSVCFVLTFALVTIILKRRAENVRRVPWKSFDQLVDATIPFESLCEGKSKDRLIHEGLSSKQSSLTKNEGYLLGLGIGDITGPAVEVELMGYANPAQVGTGLRMRLRSRAFIVCDISGSNRWVLINADIAMGDTAIRRGVIEQLKVLYPGLYDESNIGLVGTHSHSGVAGFIQNFLPQITSKGFVKQNYDAIISGTVLAIKRAHENLAPGSLSHGRTKLMGTNINRSPWAYAFNPKEERDLYKYDVDKDFDLIKFSNLSDGKPRGFMSWFPVHGTSVFRNNTLVGSDNKGIAAYLYESAMESPETMPGDNKFIAGFFQSNVGDTTPNVLGAYCEYGVDAGKKCSFERSLCGNRTEPCQGRGPAFPGDDWASNEIIGRNQKDAAGKLMSSELNYINGSVKSIYTTVDMSSYEFKEPSGKRVKTCPPAMGFSFAGGTTDGAGAFDFYQGNNKTKIHQNPLWNLIGSAVGGIPNHEQIKCHAPKPILLNTGFANFPYDWSPKIVDVQVFKAGRLVILIVPGEFTTMAGRRLRNSFKNQLMSEGILDENAIVILTGPANTYTHYVTTEEEYEAQRYEGGSTIYGPKTLSAYIDVYSKLAGFLSDNNHSALDPGPGTSDLRHKALSFVTDVAFDGTPLGKEFGQVLVDVDPNSLHHAGEKLTVIFQAGNPRNDLRLEDSYLRVQHKVKGNWKNVRSDSHPSTILEWYQTNFLLGHSEVKISWIIETNTSPGVYRIVYQGHAKPLNIGTLIPIRGVSNTFIVGS